MLLLQKTVNGVKKEFSVAYRFSHKKYCCKNCNHQHWRKLNPEKEKSSG